MQVKKETQTGSSLFSEMPDNGCMACWNKKPEGNNQIRRGVYTSHPVYVVDGNKYFQLCHVAKCTECGKIKYYGLKPGIYRLNGSAADFGIAYWPEVKKLGINPVKFITEVLKQQEPGNIYVQLDEVR